jgi:hypothetical protein
MRGTETLRRELLTVVVLALLAPELLAQRPARPVRVPRAAYTVQLLGSHANAWSAAAVGVNGTSAALDTRWASNCSGFGNTSAAATISVQFSADGVNFYTSAMNTGAVTGNFGINFTTAARFVRLISNAAATITASLQCKAS